MCGYEVGSKPKKLDSDGIILTNYDCVLDPLIIYAT